MSDQPAESNPARWLVTPPSIVRWLVVFLCACIMSASAAPLRIMPLGDSITAGYTDNPNWNVPFEFGYRSRLYTLLTNAGYDFVFVGGSLEPFNNAYGDPTKGGTVSPTFDLRTLTPNQNGHRGYGGKTITFIETNVASYLTADTPDVILMMIGINGIASTSPTQLDSLVNTIFTNRPTVKLVTAQIIPKLPFTQLVVDYNTSIRNTIVPKFVGQGRAISTVDQYVNFLTNPAVNTSINSALYSNAINHPTATGYNAMAETWFKGVLAIVPPTLPVLDQTEFTSVIAPFIPIGNFAQPPSPCTETLAFTLISGTGDADNAKFTISGNQLRAGNYNFSNEPLGRTFSIRVRATGVTGGRIGERVFSLSLTDFDQLPDSWEMAKAGNLTSLNATGDFDHDGLTDAQEYSLSLGSYPNIDPTRYDTDVDGLSDGEEINGSAPRPPTNPTKTDTDNDNICDACEDNTGVYVSLLKTGTNPTIADTDSDGRLDGAELIDGSNPLSSSSPAALVVTTGSSTTSTSYNTSPSNSDLLQGLTGVHTGWLTGTSNNSASPIYLNDGVHGDDLYPPVKGGWSAGSGTVTSVYTLPAGTGNGWDITGITTIAAWTGGGFGNQKYTVSVRKVGETAFTSLASVDHHPFTPTSSGGSRVQISHPTGKLATRVDAIQFTMLAIPTTYSNGGRAVYREFDVFGTASSAVVIPAAKVLAIGSPATGSPRSSVIWSSYPGKTYRVETSENLSSWTVLSNAFPSGGVTTRFQQDFTPTAPPRAFYRITANP